ncbi:T9SS type A sorting domain-containing protein [Carboxylicivirga linearis]|uniref:T9SS type A sorting domain-containing protein n=1 Tax=Carboxylicivirga linearis TaxID=1628157 RepID=A0ABS5K1J8_9BACT|nr:T9SS type A sorting domain-containing protein [Carboxylicivirga linearis]MBS2101017.1 T9SS type A sorting domain-containing protein [Carboxylicivirga linearis]
MKTLILPSILLIVTLPLCAQSSDQLPLETGVWKTETVNCWADEFMPEIRNYHREYNRLYAKNDTVLNDTTYQVITTDSWGTMGAIRQDSCLVYYKPMENNTFQNEFVLYDFGITESFTIQMYNLEDPLTFYVQEIDSVEINGTKHKRIRFQNDDYLTIGQYWIEGIGSSGGLLKPFYYTEIPTCENCCGVEENLVCLTVNDELIYISENYSDCDNLITSINNNATEETLQYFHDNNSLQITAKNNLIINSIKVYNSQGILIQTVSTNASQEITIQLKTKGLVIICIETNKGLISKKIIH